MTVLVTGGAGYVGSHVLLELASRGIPCVTIDSLSRGRRELVLNTPFVGGDVRDSRLVRSVLESHAVDVVMHFAAYAYVGESVERPKLYYENNVAATVALLSAAIDVGIKCFVFSSTCATYGLPERNPIPEDHRQVPISPYGASKLMIERMLKDFEAAYGLRSVVFRYFNAAGAHPSGVIGEWHDPETHLVPIALETALGRHPSLTVYGMDYSTPDGTCIRDYIHVSDLARAHVLGLEHLRSGGSSEVFNLGNGSGFSVREVIDSVERVTGQKVAWTAGPRRAGDPDTLVGSADKVRQLLGWAPEFPELDTIVATAWQWHRNRVG